MFCLAGAERSQAQGQSRCHKSIIDHFKYLGCHIRGAISNWRIQRVGISCFIDEDQPPSLSALDQTIPILWALLDIQSFLLS